MRKWVNWSIFALVGLLLAVGTLLVHYFLVPIAVNYQVNKQLALVNGSEAWDRFVNTPIPLILNVYFFNLDNPEGILQGETPKVTEVGPYVYREKWEKVDIRVDEEKDTISYRQKVEYIFDQELSGNLTDLDKVSFISPVIFVVGSIIDGLPALNLANEMIEFALPTMAGPENYGAVFTATVRDILLNGVRLHCSGDKPFVVKFICNAFKDFLPVPYLRLLDDGDLMFSILNFKELGPLMEINRGFRDPSKMGRIIAMNGMSKLSSWKCDSANIVDGYDMTLMSPFVKRTSIPLFTYDIQSTLQMLYRWDTEFEGISGYRFTLGPDLFGDPATNRKSRCYCPGSIKNLTIPAPCTKGSGVLDISSCLSSEKLKEMKPLLYHLEYHIENGYFDKLPKGQVIKMVIGNDGGVQTLYGRGTGSGKVMFSSGKSVLFAMDRSREELKVVFRAYSDNKLLGEAVKIFKGTSFPKRTEAGEAASYTFRSDLGFRKSCDLVGAVNSFIRMTSFGENIISDCIKDGNYYRVRMTSLIVERNKDPKKNVKPWWVILDGRRLRFSRWLRAVEKEDCTKEIFLKVKKHPDEDDVPGSSETVVDEQEYEVALETVEAALKKDFEFIREFGSQETYDKGSQVNFIGDPSCALRLNSFGIKLSDINCSEQKKPFTSFSYLVPPHSTDDTQVKNSPTETVLSSEARSSSCEIKGSKFIVYEEDNNQTTSDNICDEVVSDSIQSNILSNKKLKADDIFHFERSRNDLLEDNKSTGSSGVTSLISEDVCAKGFEAELSMVTGRSFLAETIVREIIDIFIEKIFEREYCSLEDHAIESMTEESNKVVRVVGYGDTESLMDLSVLGVANASAHIDLALPVTSSEENEMEKEERGTPKTINMCGKKIPLGGKHSNEECPSQNCKEMEYVSANDLQHASCKLSMCTDQKIFEDSLDYRAQGRNETDDWEYRKPISNSVDHCISEWIIKDVITQCFVCDEETSNEQLEMAIKRNQKAFVEPTESSNLPRPEDECKHDIIQSSEEISPMQIITSNTHHSSHAESEPNYDCIDKSSSENSLGTYQVKKNQNEDKRFMEECHDSAMKTEVTVIEQEQESGSNEEMKT